MVCFHLQVLVHLLQCIGTNGLHSVLHRLGLRPVQRQPRQRKGTDQLLVQPLPSSTVFGFDPFGILDALQRLPPLDSHGSVFLSQLFSPPRIEPFSGTLHRSIPWSFSPSKPFAESSSCVWLPLVAPLAWCDSAAVPPGTCAVWRPRILPRPWDGWFACSIVSGHGPSHPLCRPQPHSFGLDTAVGGLVSSSLAGPWFNSYNRFEHTSANAHNCPNGFFLAARLSRCWTMRSRFLW